MIFGVPGGLLASAPPGEDEGGRAGVAGHGVANAVAFHQASAAGRWESPWESYGGFRYAFSD